MARPQEEDSWIDISSLPSTSSLSSAEEIITTGLRVQDQTPRKRRRSSRHVTAPHRLELHANNSSQEEYEESESESDHVLTYSNEPTQASEDDADDENATAIAGYSSTFRPQPNAFSHPPAHRQSVSAGTSYNPAHNRPRANPRHSYPFHAPYDQLSPSNQVDHDAALRASLSTLLSCAAARRPKTSAPIQPYPPLVSNEILPSTIGIVPESAILGGNSDTEKSRRKTSQARSSSKERRALKKARLAAQAHAQSIAASSNGEISPTLVTWVLGAGMLVLVSAISFSAGYVVGRETGYAEAAGLGEVGHEVKRNLPSKGSGLGLRKWTGAAVGISV